MDLGPQGPSHSTERFISNDGTIILKPLIHESEPERQGCLRGSSGQPHTGVCGCVSAPPHGALGIPQPQGAISLATVAVGSVAGSISSQPVAPTLDPEGDKEVGSGLGSGLEGCCGVRTGVPQPGQWWRGVERERGSLVVWSAE